jgi:uncharacterized NAD(P)/FAD-binding protein YdhS
MTSQRTSVAIVGGGFSGAMTAVHLLKQRLAQLDITIVEPRSELGRGIAYSTQCPEHLLNVPASEMSALPQEADHFLKFARGQDSSISADSFVARKVYGDYVNSIVAQQITGRNSGRNCLRHLRSEVVDLEASGNHYALILADGSRIDADYVVLALGNLGGKQPGWLKDAAIASHAYIHDPWDTKAIEAVCADEDVLIIGSGLTAIDKIVELKSKGHKAHIYVLSRRGLFPNRHTKNYQRRPQVEFKYLSVLSALKNLRRRVADLASTSDVTDWRQVVDELRPITQQWWLSLPQSEQKRFVRHLQTYWDIHRHRMACEISDKIEKTRQTGKLEIIAGRIIQLGGEGKHLTIEVMERGKKTSRNICVSKIINCTGPQSSLETIDSPLLTNLRRRGLIHCHVLGTGIAVRPDGQIVDQKDQVLKGLFAIGPLLKATLMESVAVPELRRQALNLATRIASLAKREDCPDESALEMA